MRTSITDPLRIDTITLPSGGRLGLSICPGKKQPVSMTGGWNRDLDTDIQAVKDWGAALVITLMEEHELHEVQVAELGEKVTDSGMDWVWMPLVDDGTPDSDQIATFRRFEPYFSEVLSSGQDILIHCRGGIGRTSVIASLLMVHAGFTANWAVNTVRQTRPGSFHAPGQDAFPGRYEREILGRYPPPSFGL